VRCKGGFLFGREECVKFDRGESFSEEDGGAQGETFEVHICTLRGGLTGKK